MAKLIFNGLQGTFDLVLSAASELPYDNAGDVHITADNVQGALSELDTAIAGVANPLSYQGTWSAVTNTPTLANTDTGVSGYLYQVIDADVVNFGAGPISFEIGDKVVNNGTIWEKWDMTDAVSSVNGATGAVTVNAINQLTGDVTASTASGSQAKVTTLATVNSNVGSFGSATQVTSLTVNAKGLVTAASNTAIQIAESQVTNLVSDLALKAPLASPALTGSPTAPTQTQADNSTKIATTAYVDTGLATKQATGNYITALTGDVTAAGPGSSAATLATVNSNVGSFGSATNVAAVTVNAKGLVTAASSTAIQITESQVTNLTSDLALKAPLASPALTGSPTAPTQTQADNSTKLATTAYVDTGLALKAPIASPTFTGVATSPAFTFTPQVADPGSPTEGETQYADGTVRTEGLWVYKNGAWEPVGANAGFIATDWVSYTPTFTGFGTVSVSNIKWRRNGPDVLIKGTFAGGTTTAVEARISLPNSITSAAGLPTLSSGGSWIRGNGSLTAHGGRLLIEASLGYFTFTDAAVYGSASLTPLAKANANSVTAGGGEVLSIEISVPIATWSANTVAAVQSVNARAHNSATTISGTLATIVWTTEDYDTDSALSAGVFTAPSTGKYQVNVGLAVAGTFILNNTSIMQLQVNGTSVSDVTRYIAAAITNEHIQLSDTIALTAGDTVRIQYSTQGTAPTIVNSNTRNFFSIAKIG